jgi:RNA polymerase sigma-70 factor, ECF subfamily
MGPHTEAIERVYRTRYGAFRSALATITGDRDSAHDAVQEAFARALAQQSRLRREQSLEAWIWKIALRVALGLRRQHVHLASFDQIDVRLVEHERDPELAEAIRHLTPRRRLIFFLRYLGDLSYEQIAEVCSISQGAVAAALSEARQSVREELNGNQSSSQVFLRSSSKGATNG